MYNSIYDKSYYVDSQLGNYKDYRKKRFRECAIDIIDILQLTSSDSVVDFGCATGGLVKELLSLNISNIKGTDISNWAISYGKNELGLNDNLEYYNQNLLFKGADYILMLDVLEHLPNLELDSVLSLTCSGLGKLLLIRVPVSLHEGENYFLDVSKNDKTHIQIHCKEWWVSKFKRYDLYLKDLIYSNTIYNSNGVLAGTFKKGEQYGI